MKSKIQELIKEGKIKVDISGSEEINKDMAKKVKVVEEYLANPENLKCPVCKSTDIKDVSTYQSNGRLWHYSSWKTFDARCCNECGVIFKPVKKSK